MSACLHVSPTMSGEEPNYRITPKNIKDGKRKIKEICLSKTNLLDVHGININEAYLSDSQWEKLSDWIETVCANTFKKWKEEEILK